MYNKHWDAFMQPVLQWKSNTYFIFWVCVHWEPRCSLRTDGRKETMKLFAVLWKHLRRCSCSFPQCDGASGLSNIAPLILIHGMFEVNILWYNVLIPKKCWQNKSSESQLVCYIYIYIYSILQYVSTFLKIHHHAMWNAWRKMSYMTLKNIFFCCGWYITFTFLCVL